MSTSTQGQTLQFAVGSLASHAVTQAYAEIRPDEMPDLQPATVEVAENPNVGHAHWADMSDKPVTYERFKESAIAINYRMRANSGAVIDFIESAFKSAGCVATRQETAEELQSDLSTAAFSTTSNLLVDGECAILGDAATGGATPCVTFGRTGSGPYSHSALFAPGITGDVIRKGVTIVPATNAVSSTSLLSFKRGTRLSGDSYEEHFAARGCALASVGEFTIKPGQPIIFPFTFHAADMVRSDEALSEESFADTEKFPIIGGQNFECAFATSPTAQSWSAIANTAGNKLNLIEAKVNLGIGAAPIEGSGNSSLNDLQGYHSIYSPATISLKCLYDSALFDDLEDGTFVERYLHFVQRSSDFDAVPCFGLFFPRVRLNGKPTMIADLDSVYLVEIPLIATGAEINGDVDNDDFENSPWFLAYNLVGSLGG